MPLKSDSRSEDKKIKEFGEHIKVAIGLSIDNIQGINDMLESEMISSEFADRLISGEKLSIVKDIQNFLDFYRGLN